MRTGQTNAALRTLSDKSQGHSLPLDQLCSTGETVREVLKSKHPTSSPPTVDALIPDSSPEPEFHPISFVNITGQRIRQIVLRCMGLAGQSGLDASAWQRLCTSFGRCSADLCSSIAALARRLCTDHVDPAGLSSSVACRLIALDKNPGVRPMGVGEVLRRIVGKAIMTVVKDDVQRAAGANQLCAGQEAGCEAAVHAVRRLFTDTDAECAILVDASNAFNFLNRQVTLRNVQKLCPPIATALLNCYRGDAELYIGGETILSTEGTTQGDPLAMAFYVLATVPLSKALTKQEISGDG